MHTLVCVFPMCKCPWRPLDSWNWSYRRFWAAWHGLETNIQSSRRAESILGAISSVPNLLCLNENLLIISIQKASFFPLVRSVSQAPDPHLSDHKCPSLLTCSPPKLVSLPNCSTSGVLCLGLQARNPKGRNQEWLLGFHLSSCLDNEANELIMTLRLDVTSLELVEGFRTIEFGFSDLEAKWQLQYILGYGCITEAVSVTPHSIPPTTSGQCTWLGCVFSK